MVLCYRVSSKTNAVFGHMNLKENALVELVIFIKLWVNINIESCTEALTS